jgi:6-phosphogluconolactonase/glucosamine-6-phosphate isomerase/deaminase
MRLIVREDPDATATYVANYIATRIKEHYSSSNRPFVLGLPTGGSPIGVYKKLVQKYKAGEVRPQPPDLLLGHVVLILYIRSHSTMSLPLIW